MSDRGLRGEAADGTWDDLLSEERVPRPSEAGSLVDAVAAMLSAGLTEKDVAEVLARTPAEDEFVVIREVLGRRFGV